VSTLRQSFTDLLHSLREPRDELLLELGADGEVLLARLRLALASVLMLLPAVNYLAGGGGRETLIGFIGVGLSVVLSQVWLGIARRRKRVPWLPYVSTGFDVSMVTLVLLLLAFNDPAAGLNSVVVWCCYPLVVMASALRNNVRVTLFAGALGIAEFLLVSFVFQGVSDGPIHSEDYGTVAMSTQLQRAAAAVLHHRGDDADRVPHAAPGAAVGHRRPHRPAEPQLPQPPRAAHPRRRPPGRRHRLPGAARPRLLQAHQRRPRPPGGDRALRHVVDVLRLELRRDEPMLRVGGEEFVVLLAAAPGAGWERMDGLRRKLQAVEFQPGDGYEARSLTMSCGVACSPDDAIDVSGLMRTADLRLRLAKQHGRNRVVARDSA
jgi:GGDEF domain-containing protein